MFATGFLLIDKHNSVFADDISIVMSDVIADILDTRAVNLLYRITFVNGIQSIH